MRPGRGRPAIAQPRLFASFFPAAEPGAGARTRLTRICGREDEDEEDEEAIAQRCIGTRLFAPTGRFTLA